MFFNSVHECSKDHEPEDEEGNQVEYIWIYSVYGIGLGLFHFAKSKHFHTKKIIFNQNEYYINLISEAGKIIQRQGYIFWPARKILSPL